jgi:hypothetical protein
MCNNLPYLPGIRDFKFPGSTEMVVIFNLGEQHYKYGAWCTTANAVTSYTDAKGQTHSHGLVNKDVNKC